MSTMNNINAFRVTFKTSFYTNAYIQRMGHLKYNNNKRYRKCHVYIGTQIKVLVLNTVSAVILYDKCCTNKGKLNLY